MSYTVEDFLRKRDELAGLFNECTDLLIALGDENRQKIVTKMMYAEGSRMRVVEIAESSDLSRPAVSHHMQILKNAGLVKSEKKGTTIYYRLVGDSESIRKFYDLAVTMHDICSACASLSCKKTS